MYNNGAHNNKITSHWGNLVPRINFKNARIQQVSLYVFLYIHAVFRHVTLVVWVYYYKCTIENNLFQLRIKAYCDGIIHCKATAR
jgi:hypothetical protein